MIIIKRITDILTVILFLNIISSLGVLLLVLPEKGFSEEENRTLAAPPQLSVSSLLSGSFSAEAGSFCSDNLPLRNAFIKTKAISELALGKGENNGIIYGKDGYLLADYDGDFKRFTENVDDMISAAGRKVLPVSVCVIGRSSDVLTNRLPLVHPDMNTEWIFGEIAKADGYIDAYDALLQKNNEYIYYKTDHHLTTLGSYYVYRKIIECMGDVPYELSDFTPVTVSESFYGSLWSSSGMLPVEPDSVTLYRFDGDGDYTVKIADTGAGMSGFYDFSYLEQKDKYGMFLSGVNARVDISKTDKTGENREKLLLIKDSFSHSVAPFLARHYDLILIDPRYYKTSIYTLCEQENMSQILILCGVDNLIKLDGFFDLLKVQ